MDPSQIDPTLIASLLMMQGQNPNAGMPGLGQGMPGLGASLMGQGFGGAQPVQAPSWSSASSPTGDQPVPWAPGAQPGYMGVNPTPVPGTQTQGGPGDPTTQTPIPGVTVQGLPIGSVPPGFNASTQSPGTAGVGGGGTVPSTAAQAGGPGMAGLGQALQGFKGLQPPVPIMPHAAPPVPGAHAVQANAGQQLAALLAALMPRGQAPTPIQPGMPFGR